jgi:hypothetical protein
VVGISVPAEFVEEPPATESKKNEKVTWTEYSRTWEKRRALGRSSILLTISTWDADWATVTGQKTDVTPEKLLLAEFLTALEKKGKGENPVEEITDLELSGVRGLYEVVGYRDDAGRVFLGWHTYRNYRGKPQQISVGIFGERRDFDRLKSVIQSLKLSN